MYQSGPRAHPGDRLNRRRCCPRAGPGRLREGRVHRCPQVWTPSNSVDAPAQPSDTRRGISPRKPGHMAAGGRIEPVRRRVDGVARSRKRRLAGGLPRHPSSRRATTNAGLWSDSRRPWCDHKLDTRRPSSGVRMVTRSPHRGWFAERARRTGALVRRSRRRWRGPEGTLSFERFCGGPEDACRTRRACHRKRNAWSTVHILLDLRGA